MRALVPASNSSPGDLNAGLTVWIVEDNGNRYLAMKFNRPTDAAALQLQYLPQVSADKQTWYSDSANVLQLDVSPVDAQVESVTVRDLTPITPSAARFIRLHVVAN